MPSVHLKNHKQEKQLFSHRVSIAATATLLLLLLLLGRAFYLQVIQHNRYATLSQKNQISTIPIPPNRGLIYDRNGILLAENTPGIRLDIIPELVKDLPGTLEKLSKLINLTPEEIENFYQRRRQQRAFHRIPIRLQLSEEEVATFSINQYQIPGVVLSASLIRHYPFGEAFAHVIGYLGKINEAELTQLDRSRYLGSHMIGKTGVEKIYEPLLFGEVGRQQVETDSRGRIIRSLEKSNPTPGHNLYLTLDAPTQLAAFQALDQKQGAVVALDPKTGAVLALVSTPSFDPNVFSSNLDSKTFLQLQNASNRPLYNRALQGQYPPASTIKPFIGLIGLATGAVTPETTISDPGWFQLSAGGRRYRDWRKEGHGQTNLRKAISQSCDTYYYRLADKLGIDVIAEYLNQFGFGHLTQIDQSVENRGVVPSTAWKMRTQRTQWYRGDTLSAGIGQGYMLATPIQLAKAVGMIATHGVAYQPFLLSHSVANTGSKKTTPIKEQPALVLQDPTIWDEIIAGMQEVISSPQGTAHRLQAKSTYSFAGKTGTAQVFSLKQDEKYHADRLETHLKDHTLFIAFAPIEDPTIAVAVVIENSPGSPEVAQAVMNAYLRKNQ
jgi:penicillin-binding protein 2